MSLLDTADTSDPTGPTHHLLSPKELSYAQVLPPGRLPQCKPAYTCPRSTAVMLASDWCTVRESMQSCQTSTSPASQDQALPVILTSAPSHSVRFQGSKVI